MHWFAVQRILGLLPRTVQPDHGAAARRRVGLRGRQRRVVRGRPRARSRMRCRPVAAGAQPPPRAPDPRRLPRRRRVLGRAGALRRGAVPAARRALDVGRRRGVRSGVRTHHHRRDRHHRNRFAAPVAALLPPDAPVAGRNGDHRARGRDPAGARNRGSAALPGGNPRPDEGPEADPSNHGNRQGGSGTSTSG